MKPKREISNENWSQLMSIVEHLHRKRLDLPDHDLEPRPYRRRPQPKTGVEFARLLAEGRRK